MQVSEREQFEAHLSRLYGAYNMPLSKVRTDAYFGGLTKMPLWQFARCIDYCLSEKGPEKIPSVPAIWSIRKKMTLEAAPKEQSKQDPDHLEFYANRLLLLHLTTRLGLGSTGKFTAGEAHLSGMSDCRASAELDACRKVTRELVEFYCELIEEGSSHANPSSFVGDWVKQIASVSAIAPKALSTYTGMIANPQNKQPFPPYMARHLERKSA